MYYRNRQTEAVGSMQFVAGFCTALQLRIVFTYIKKLFKKENSDRDSLWHTKPKIFTTWFFTENVCHSH